MVASALISETAASPNPAHLDEWTQGSGVERQLAELNLRSLSDTQAIAQRLNWRAYSGQPGWYVQGVDPLTGETRQFGQFKPDEPIYFPDSDKPHKYLTFPKGSESEVICQRVTLDTWQRVATRYGVEMPEVIPVTQSGEALGFWAWILEHPQIPITITEGLKKAACLLSGGYVAISITGVWNGQKKKRTLIPTLKPFITVGRPVDLAFDADILVKPEVQHALRVLGHLLNRAKAIVRILEWDLSLGKGCDDFIVKNGFDSWEEIVDSATPYSEWLKQLELQFQSETQLTKERQQQPSPVVVGRQIAQEYAHRLCWSEHHRNWMLYSHQREGVWMPISLEFLNNMIDRILEAQGIDANNSFISNVVGKLQRQLYEPTWDERPTNELLPFTDGVLEVATGQLHKHSPNFRLTWCLPRPYSVVGLGWTRIEDWLKEATRNNLEHIRILLCFAAAVLRGRADLQKFLHLVGVGGTGKSTFANILEILVGKENTAAPNLRELETEKDVIADLQTKRLIILPDEDGYVKMQNFKRLTGQDNLEGRHLYKNRVRFKFSGMVVVTSNGPIFKGVGGSWLTRRLIMIPFDYKPPASRVRNLLQEFESEMSAFTLYLLSIPDEEITRVLKGLDNEEVNSTVWDDRVRADSIAAFIEEHIIHDPLAITPIGDNKDEWKNEEYNPSASTLFGAYQHFCRMSGLNHPVSKNNFSPNFIEICQQTLHWEDVQKVRNSTGVRCIQGVRLRTKGDGSIPPPSDDLKQTSDIPESDNLSGNLSDNLSDNPKALQDKVLDSSDNLNCQKLLENPNGFQGEKDLGSTAMTKVLTTQVEKPSLTSAVQGLEVVSIDCQEGCQEVDNSIEYDQELENGVWELGTGDCELETRSNCETDKITNHQSPITNPQPQPIDPNHPLAQYLVAMPRAKMVTTPEGQKVELPAQYPGRKAINQTKEPLEIRKKALATSCKQEWKTLINDYGYLCVVWVWRWLLPKPDKRRLTSILKGEIEQLNLLSLQEETLKPTPELSD